MRSFSAIVYFVEENGKIIDDKHGCKSCFRWKTTYYQVLFICRVSKHRVILFLKRVLYIHAQRRVPGDLRRFQDLSSRSTNFLVIATKFIVINICFTIITPIATYAILTIYAGK